VVGLTSYAPSAVAADLTLHGSATVMNKCSVSILPALIPPTSHRVAITVASDASWQPHLGRPITLSNTSVEIQIGANLFQSAVDSGFMSDGFTIPATVAVTLSGTNTSEGAHTFAQSMTLRLNVVNGDARPLVATLALPDSVWHPVSPYADLFFSEKSARIVLTLDLSSTVGATLVHTSTCTPLSVTPFVALAVESPPPPPAPTSTTQAPASTLTGPPIIGPATTAPTATALPRTGSNSGYGAFVGLSCIAAGVLLLGRSRRRQRE
jgi:LPXTG-motif cell wall-anchored protein